MVFSSLAASCRCCAENPLISAVQISAAISAEAVALHPTDPFGAAQAAQRMGGDLFLVVETFISGVVAILVGALRDPAHGFVLTVGAGGVLGEVLDDIVSMLVPVTGAEIDAALDRLRIAPLLRGYRGAPPVDREGLVAAILSVQDCIVAHADDL